MTKSDWLTVAMVAAVIISAIATLLAPALAVHTQSRINQQRPKPDAEQPGNILQKLWRYIDVKFNWPGFVGALVSLSIFMIGFFRAKLHIDRYSVTWITLGIGGAFYFVTGFIVLKGLNRLWSAIAEIKSALRKRKR